MTVRLRIRGGEVYDPANGVEGDVRDVLVEDGRIVADLPAGVPELDARGLVVFPGGVDLHCHIAGSKVTLARRLSPERARAEGLPAPELEGGTGRAGTGGVVPSSFATGYLYAGLGYTAAIDAAIAPLGARQAHAELADVPLLDSGFLALLGNNALLLSLLEAGERERFVEAAGWILEAAGALGMKAVNPGGVAAWKAGASNVAGLDDPIGGTAITPRVVVTALADAAADLRLPHPLHLHCNNLGMPGNAATTLATMQALEGRRAHFAHLQFHSYGGEPGGLPVSAAPAISEYVNGHENLSFDVGQVMFGPATVMTADEPAGYLLHRLTGRKWVNLDIEVETGCGVLPFEYRDRNRVHAVQWAVGLELFLLARDPWRVVLSTDHPNGGSFRAYPRLIRLLMDRAFRDEELRRLPEGALAGSALADGLEREYTLSEISIVTRAAPARLAGLTRKGHLGPGADADLALYPKGGDAEAMFSAPRYVIKGGTVVLEEGQLRRSVQGVTLRSSPLYDPGAAGRLRPAFESRYSIRMDNYPVAAEMMRGEGRVGGDTPSGGSEPA
ncbi:MAG: formylmethanofuran dehydrogenase subunit A [Gemmatimonadetes bacterium]|nr:formylmethanofuran dehydrogenase subunit A [Gemmatimonadota bacterium]